MPKTILLRIGTAAMIGLLLAGFSPVRAGAGEEALTAEQKELNRQSFEMVWSTIRDKHYDPTLGGLDWNAVHAELLPEMEAATTMDEARQVLRKIIARLELSHFNIIPGHLFAEMGTEESATSMDDGITGLDVRYLDGLALVTAVEPGSPAALAEIQTGWAITHIGQTELAPLLDKLHQEFAGRTLHDAVLASVVKGRLNGPVGETVTVTFLDGEDKSVTKEIVRIDPPGQKYRLGYLPPFHVWIKTRPLDGNIGYIAFNAFMDPVQLMPKFNEAMQQFMTADGLIIDLRGNGGGLPNMATGMAGWLIDRKNLHLGTVYYRDSELKIIVRPRPEIFKGPVAVLIDGLSASCSEFMAGGLKDLDRARIFGSTTAGAALPSIVVKLPNGDGFQYAFANYRSAGGDVLEGNGVTPHEPIMPARAALLQGEDPVLDGAVAWIKSQGK
ncbi:MAG: hypothetical protein JXQ27_16180 [Acidobacteria bacterium]|nr:hypothetical protein [Acidobacteriota bacterium]